MQRSRKTTGVIMAAAVTLALGAGFVLAGTPLSAPEKELIVEGKKPARFTHKTHTAQGMECGVCHHDREHTPLDAEDIASVGDAAKLGCVSCHNGEFANADLRKAKDVFHGRCKTCHKEGYDGKKGPQKCSGCHLKKKKTAVEGC